jgi:hypothetical protein
MDLNFLVTYGGGSKQAIDILYLIEGTSELSKDEKRIIFEFISANNVAGEDLVFMWHGVGKRERVLFDAVYKHPAKIEKLLFSFTPDAKKAKLKVDKKPIKNMAGWHEVKNDVRTFKLGEEPELIHIIKTGFKNKYMVVSEDAYELHLGEVRFYTKEAIWEKLHIRL